MTSSPPSRDGVTASLRAKSERELKKHIRALCTKIGPRMIGTPGDHESAVYVESCFKRWGLQVISNTIPCWGWDLLSTSLKVDGRPLRAIGNMYSPAGKGKGVLVLSEPDIPDGGFRAFKGKVVAVYGDFAPFPSRLNAFAMKAERAGAASVVVIDTNHQTYATKLIRERELKGMPVMSVSLDTGYQLARREGGIVEFSVQAKRYKSDTRDVIGILEGGPREICIEAHRDTAPDTPGADDNGSGAVVLLELARLLSLSPRRHTMRFVSATAEEFGNVGTPVYAKRFAQELKRIDLIINADCVGNMLCPLKVYVQKKDTIGPLVDTTIRSYPALNLVRTEDRYGGQILHYLGKSVNAVNVLCDWTNARIHTPEDNPAHLSYAKMAQVTHFLRDVILAYDARR